MLDLRPLAGHLVVAARAAATVVPAPDPVTGHVVGGLDPDGYLGALPPTEDDGEAALRRRGDHLDRLLRGDRYRPITGPALVVLALGPGPTAPDGSGARERSVAIVGDVPVTAFDDGRVLPHEEVRDPRVAALARYLEVVGRVGTPITVAQRPDARVEAATAAVVATAPDVAFRATDGTDVALWCRRDPATIATLTAAVAGAGRGYVADGHHRVAAAVRHDRAGHLLTAVLPSDHLRLRPHPCAGSAGPSGQVPTTVDEVLATADAGRRVPPKTTSLTPKVPSGLLVVDRAAAGLGAQGSRP